tara:strand:+ start:516 stop:728 length:213 start_codon:yes stop_codon:yes gene_type:complete
MKIEINMYDETGENIIAKAMETDCKSLVVNGVHVISDGGVGAEMRELIGNSGVRDGGTIQGYLGNIEPIN